jgi:flavin prenyltransferase
LTSHSAAAENGCVPTKALKTIILGVTGASGAIFARRTLQMLEGDARVSRIHLVISGAGLKVLRDELDLDVGRSASIPSAIAGAATSKVEYLLDSDIGAAIASGSHRTDGMTVIPCSAGCLAQIAHGLSQTLIERAADVCLKEGRKLILALRETPLNRAQLRNMLLAQEAGAEVFPIMPSFYHRPQTIDDLVTQFCCRVLAHLGLEQENQFRWTGENENQKSEGSSSKAGQRR